MMAKRTIIGMIVGSAIIGIGLYSLIVSFDFKTIELNETFGVGESTSYQIRANSGASQTMSIIGEKFDLKLSSPSDGLQIPNTSYTGEATFDWVHLDDGVTMIKLQNLGSTDLQVNASLNLTQDPILFTYHLVVITSGVVIIGFSMGFTLRKPKGF